MNDEQETTAGLRFATDGGAEAQVTAETVAEDVLKSIEDEDAPVAEAPAAAEEPAEDGPALTCATIIGIKRDGGIAVFDAKEVLGGLEREMNAGELLAAVNLAHQTLLEQKIAGQVADAVRQTLFPEVLGIVRNALIATGKAKKQ